MVSRVADSGRANAKQVARKDSQLLWGVFTAYLNHTFCYLNNTFFEKLSKQDAKCGFQVGDVDSMVRAPRENVLLHNSRCVFCAIALLRARIRHLVVRTTFRSATPAQCECATKEILCEPPSDCGRVLSGPRALVAPENLMDAARSFHERLHFQGKRQAHFLKTTT